MESQRFPLTLIAGALLLGLGACADAAETGAVGAPASGRTIWKPAAPVSVVLILIDTLRADAILDSDGRYDTPNIDRLGQEGVVFPRVFSAAPMTLPSHISMFSSRPPFETKVLNNWQSVPKDLPLLAEWLSEHGYDTRAVISLGTLNPPAPGKGPSRGFASYDYDYWCMSQAEHTQGRLLASLREREADQPLFLFAHFSDPHEPYNSHGTESKSVQLFMDGELVEELVTSDMSLWSKTIELSEGRTVFEFRMPERPSEGRFRVRKFECWDDGEELEATWETAKPMDRVKHAVLAVDRGSRKRAPCEVKVWVNDVPPSDDSRRQRYAQEVAYVDRYVGELLQELERTGLYQDSLIVFTSDHGEAMGERKFFGHAEGLTDDQIHVPLIIRLPRGDPRREELARAAASMVTHLDLVPTMLEIIGAPPLPGQRGTSLFEPHAAVHIAQAHKPEAQHNKVALRDERFKMIHYPDEGRYELYDLVADPGELQDVFAQRQGERAEWPERLRWLYEQSVGQFEDEGSDADREAREHMLQALGYGGGGEGK